LTLGKCFYTFFFFHFFFFFFFFEWNLTCHICQSDTSLQPIEA
jgi:hypothetical protein